ncbi:hypothetical protein HPP92_006085 [Vanilla planifolia]|uniref:Calmodulin binding protein-like N-terminal domain-containing protein n=1 Tax=Vanilla planifolia TaxID=51239 RepID=A0A835RUW5_VANPL|nr:hypothetical protein HPP92_006401 [Vanilla planifolia]KAG0495091.1 hypothetical protein HPP92_006085 [Vanilla planifolia]
MATKRHLEDPGDPTASKRMRSLPSLRMVIMEAVVAKSTQNFCLVLETVFRKVVKEEVERGLARRAPLLQRSPPMHIEESSSSMLQLLFKKPPSLPIFTENNIQDEDGNPLEILLVDIRSGKRPQALSHSSIKVELVVLDGDFPSEETDDCFSSDFSRHIVKERRGRRPLLAGDTAITLKDGAASIDELKFTDNSSWTRSRNFRIGAQVSPRVSRFEHSTSRDGALHGQGSSRRVIQEALPSRPRRRSVAA